VTVSERQPGSRTRVVVTRSSDQASRLSERLRDAGYEPVEVPLIEVRQTAQQREGLAELIKRLNEFSWVTLTSPNAAAAFFDAVNRCRTGAEHLGAIKIAAVGPGTSETVAEHGSMATLVAATSSGQGLLDALRDVAAATVLCPQAAAARPTLVDGLRSIGWIVTPCVAYETVALLPSVQALHAAAACEAIAFASSSSVDAWINAGGGGSTPLVVVSIGPQTTASATSHGIAVAAEAAPHTLDGLVAAVGDALRRSALG
jgi:uroporphyrinogen III methyltransferase / synthase